MILPLVLILVSLSAAAAVAFGTHPNWASFDGGLAVILFSRRLQWVFVALSIISAAGLIALSISGKRRAWWLIGLLPILVLFVHRFATDPATTLGIADEPAFVLADTVDTLKDDDWLICYKLGDKNYACPYAALYLEPVVVQSDHDRHAALFWNALANRVLVFQATPDFRGRDVEVVSTPANGLLLYNSKHGEFVCGMTGLTPDRKKPQGLGAPIATQKTTWGKWRPANPQGLVMKSARVAPAGVRLPTAAIPPTHPAFGLTLASTQPATTQRVRRRLTIIGTGKPIAVDVESLSQRPSAVMVDDQPAVLLRADASGPTLRAFSRKLLDMTLRLEPKKDAKLADVRMRDLETDCLWSSAGVAVGGNSAFRGRRLSAIPVDQDVDYEVLKWWVPEIEIYSEPAPPPSTKPVSTATTKPSRKSGKTKAKAK